jgi:hypothetical protein
MSCTATGRKLTGAEVEACRRVAALVRAHGGRRTEMLADGGEAYAYPHPGGGIAWGFNDGQSGFCVARGICTSEVKR